MLDICWKCVRERVLLGLWLVNQVEESVLPAAGRILRRMAQPVKDFSVTAVPSAGPLFVIPGQIFPERHSLTSSLNG